jgi:hypothetical protein
MSNAAIRFAQNATGAAGAAPGDARPPRALWVWGCRDLLEGVSPDTTAETTAQRTFFDFLAAPHGKSENRITTLYLSGIPREALTAKPDTRQRQAARGLLQVAHRRGLKVEYLCGDPSWAWAANHGDALAYLRDVLAYNASEPFAQTRFDGFQYDVEPYLLKEWPAPQLRRDFLALLERARTEITASGKGITAASFPLGAAIPRWFDQVSLNYMDRAMLDRVDYLALMDYVDSAERLIADAENEIAFAAKADKRVVIGVETDRLPEEPGATFFQVGNVGMERALARAAQQYARSPGFGGFALHHRTSYQKMKP